MKTYERARCHFFWKGMQREIQQMVSECAPCQRHQGETTLLSGLLEPFPTPTRIWAYISMNFIPRIPKYGGNTVIFVVGDRLSKYNHFCAIRNPYTISSIAQIFMDQIFLLHGIPSSIVWDHNTTFTSHFQLTNTKLHMISVSHPPIDGPTTIINEY